MATFRVQARVLDLLGEQQIANGPTAISELFKNAHDAYATQVSLDIYPDLDRALLWDDGVGMSHHQLLENWLVVGTPGKLDSPGAAPDGAIQRPVQGEKGIGRLAISTLGDTLLLITKSRPAEHDSDCYSALLINWNITKNLALTLEDIYVPIVSFADVAELTSGIVRDMVESFRHSIITNAPKLWRSPHQLALRARILDQLDAFAFYPEQLLRTPLAKIPSGTVFYIANLRRELGEYTRPPSEQDEEQYPPNVELVQLLSNFRDTFSAATGMAGISPTYPFHADVRRWDSTSRDFASIFTDWHTFEPNDLTSADHTIDVTFDAHGRYSGSIEIFSKPIDLPPPAEQARKQLGCGPFSLRLWYYQGEQTQTRLTADQFVLIRKKLALFGGLMIYRDGLRVLPYGRPDTDWLGFEERRSRKAGRYFFSYRRMFGYVSIAAKDNPQLRDKAGREGLIGTLEYRQFRQHLADFFSDIAARYFSTDNAQFAQGLSELEMRAGLVGREQKRAAARREQLKIELARAIDDIASAEPKLNSFVDDAIAKLQSIESAGEREVTEAYVAFSDRLHRIETSSRVPSAKVSLGRDRAAKILMYDYEESRKRLRQACADANTRFTAALRERLPEAERAATRHKVLKDARFGVQARVGKAVSALNRSIDASMRRMSFSVEALRDTHLRRIDDTILRETAAINIDEALFADVDHARVLTALAALATESELTIEDVQADLVDYLDSFFGEQRSSLLAAQIDFIEELKEAADRNLDLVQLGLSVEIIDHELGKLYRGIKADLGRISTVVERHAPGVEIVTRLRSHFQHLEQRYKMMSPLYRGTYRTKVSITGTSILQFARDFLAQTIEATGVQVRATSAGHAFTVVEAQSLVLPIIVNLVDNALYWLRHSETKEVLLDARDGLLIMTDTGPGIHDALLARIFEPYFSSKPNGRGLGLYVAKANLERYGHEIWATNDPLYRTAPGACFCIRFNSALGGSQ